MSHKWTTADLADQHGRTFIITGANSGIGKQAALALAGAGARVVLAVRDESKGRQAAAEIGGATEVRRLDLASLDSVRAFADDWSGTHRRADQQRRGDGRSRTPRPPTASRCRSAPTISATSR